MEPVQRRPHAGQDDPLVAAVVETLHDSVQDLRWSKLLNGVLQGAGLVEDVAEVRSLDDSERRVHGVPFGVAATME